MEKFHSASIMSPIRRVSQPQSPLRANGAGRWRFRRWRSRGTVQCQSWVGCLIETRTHFINWEWAPGVLPDRWQGDEGEPRSVTSAFSQRSKARRFPLSCLNKRQAAHQETNCASARLRYGHRPQDGPTIAFLRERVACNLDRRSISPKAFRARFAETGAEDIVKIEDVFSRSKP